jgi:hypothetical protein
MKVMQVVCELVTGVSWTGYTEHAEVGVGLAL